MLKKLQKLPTSMTLIAHSGVQFVDYGFKSGSLTGYFREQPEQTAKGQTWVFRRLVKDGDSDDLVDWETGTSPPNTKTNYQVSGESALAAFDGAWLPVPFLKLRGQGKADGFEPAPSNWARVRVSRLDAADAEGFTHRLTIAFDTRTDDIQPGDKYTGPTLADVINASRFALTGDLSKNSWFLDEEWVRNWVLEAFAQSPKAKDLARVRLDGDGEDERYAVTYHWAYYSVLLEAMEKFVNGTTSNAALPIVHFLENQPKHSRPFDVDLVLDIGNSRTCGVLIESDGEPGVDLAKATPLELRDLSRPQFAYREPFRSHVEFAQAEFGSSFWSRESDRAQGFFWPSLMRVGPEALRLNAASTGADGDTGLSGPKRYLWDTREHKQLWQFNLAEQWSQTPMAVFGELTELLSSSGDLLEPGAAPELLPKFSKATLFCFMVVELLLQAVSQINSPGQRAITAMPDVPRRLGRVVLTIPTGTPLMERALFQQQCDKAVKLLWSVMNWGPDGVANPVVPRIDIAYDEATCTQLVWLYSEMKEKFRSKPAEFLRIMDGKVEANGGRSLRVASLDIGGGTTDLMVTTYRVDGTDDSLQPTQNFREGFRTAGDDILEAMIRVHVLGAISEALKAKGCAVPRQFLETFMRDAGKTATERHRRRLFVSRVLVPLALAILSRYEASGFFGIEPSSLPAADVLPSAGEGIAAAVAYFDEAAAMSGATGFKLRDTVLDLDFESINRTLEDVIEPIVEPLCDVMHRFQIDVLLVSGRPSRLPVIRDLLLRFMPVSPHRIVFMHEYHVGNWYPFSNVTGTIGDPKTTVVVGALLCTLANSRRIPDFSLAAAGLNAASTALYIGRIYGDGVVRAEDVLFGHRAGGEIELQSKPLFVNNPLSLGFRQLPQQRWPGTPLFFLDLPDPAPADVGRTMPWRVELKRLPVDKRQFPLKAALAVEDIRIAAIEDKNGQDRGPSRLVLRLQTLKDGAGYWLDTGVVLPI